MELHQLRYAIAVADEGAFRRAAQRCHVTQPSLSVQIAKLERELGGRLFDRLGQGTRLTPLGERFLVHARDVLCRVEAAKAAAQDELGEAAGTVRLGVIPTVAPFWLPRVLPRLRRALPRLDFRVWEEPTEPLLDRLARGALDFAVASLPLEGQGLRSTGLLREELLLALPEGHALTRRKSLRIEDVAGSPWILLMDMHCLRQQVLSFCGRSRPLDTVLETSQVASLVALVAAGLGVSLVPEMAAQPANGVVYRRLAPPRPVREIVLVSHEAHFQPPAARRFARECLDLARALRTE
jgi:LysR family hydrogen peroxide-inducible transcriptional activator